VQNDRFCAPVATETSAIDECSSIAGAQNRINLRAPRTRFALKCVSSYQRACRVGGPTNRHHVRPTIAHLVADFINDFRPLDPEASVRSCFLWNGGRTRPCEFRITRMLLYESLGETRPRERHAASKL
jgi:hypothetical protein